MLEEEIFMDFSAQTRISTVAIVLKQNHLSNRINICKVNSWLSGVKSVRDNHAVRVLLVFLKKVEVASKRIFTWLWRRVNVF